MKSFTFLNRILTISILFLIVSSNLFAGMIIDGPANARQNGKVVASLFDGVETSDEYHLSRDKWYDISFFIKVTDKEMEDKKIVEKRILYDDKGNKIGKVIAPIKLGGVYKEIAFQNLKNMDIVWFSTHVNNRKINIKQEYAENHKCKNLFDFDGWKLDISSPISFYGKCVTLKKDVNIYSRIEPYYSFKYGKRMNSNKYYKTTIKKGSKVLLIYSELISDDFLQADFTYYRVQEGYIYIGTIDDYNAPLGTNWKEYFYKLFFEDNEK